MHNCDIRLQSFASLIGGSSPNETHILNIAILT